MEAFPKLFRTTGESDYIDVLFLHQILGFCIFFKFFGGLRWQFLCSFRPNDTLLCYIAVGIYIYIYIYIIYISPHREYAYIKRKQRTDSGPIPWQSVSWRYPWQFVSRCRCVSISSSFVLVLLADPECERKVRVSAPLRRLDATLLVTLATLGDAW